MSFLEHEAHLIKALRDADYQPFDDKDEAFSFLLGRYNAFVNYANIVISEQYTMPITYARYEGEDLRQRVMQADRNRKNAHDIAIDSVNILNRMSKQLGIEPFADIDTTDRHAVADTVGNFVNELYCTGTKTGMDGAAFGKTTQYNSAVLKDRIQQAEALADGIAQTNEPTGPERA